MRARLGNAAFVAVVVVTIAVPLFASCAFLLRAPRVACSQVAPSGAFDGPLVALHGSAATFEIEHVLPSSYPSRLTQAPELSVGEEVVVHYEEGGENFLRVGRSYWVTVWWVGQTTATEHFISGVAQKSKPCSGGTVYADGSTIDTAVLQSTWVRRTLSLGAIVAAFVGMPALVMFIRRGRRQRANSEQLQEARRLADQRIRQSTRGEP